VSRIGATTTVSFQVWDWHADGERYDLGHFQLADEGAGWVVTQRTSRLWAVSQAELADCARLAGLDDARWLPPDESRFFQPLLVARVPSGRV
jgi:hypothetical protein